MKHVLFFACRLPSPHAAIEVVDLRFSPVEEAFRDQVRRWLAEHLAGDFAVLRGRGGPGDEHVMPELRRRWEQLLAAHGWTCLGWPREYGARGATLTEQVIFNEEYARARAPGRMGHIGEELFGPTLIAFGSEAQKRRFLPPIRRAEELWCQGYSEPNAGSDLANVQTRAERRGDEWIVTGQKTWTSHALHADWCFVLCRTNVDAPKHRGLSYILVPMKQPGVTVRPIRQITGTSEFNEVFFDGARTAADNVVGDVDGGWRVAMGTLAFERGVSTLAQQIAFANELQLIIDVAKENGAIADAQLRDRIVQAWIGLRVIRLNALRVLADQRQGELDRAALILKLHWSNWHRDLGELAMDVLGARGLYAPADPEAHDALGRLQRLYLFSRADTIYAGSNEIQRNLIGERALGLPPEPKVDPKTDPRAHK
jgi:alkylation response protein AidB-like acyl-CoA dehydrogenase